MFFHVDEDMIHNEGEKRCRSGDRGQESRFIEYPANVKNAYKVLINCR
jgi:hypothetical protein